MDLVKSYRKEFNKLPKENDPDYLYFLERTKALSNLQVIDRPIMIPAKCANCGAGVSDRKYIDFGLDVESYGVVYLCEFCITYAYNKLIPETQNSENHRKETPEKEDKVRLLNDVRRALEDIKGDLGLVLNLYHPSIIDNSDDTELSSMETESDDNEIQSGVDEQVTESGSENIPSLAELLSNKR